MKHFALLVALTGCLSTPPAPEGRARVWRELPDSGQPGALHGPRMTYDRVRKEVVLHGGAGVDGGTNKTWAFVRGSGWTEICPSMTLPVLYSPAFVYDPVGEQLVLAGGSTSQDFTSPSTTIYTCSSTAAGATWVPLSTPLPRAIVGGHLVYDDARDSLILVGGNEEIDTYSRASFATTNLQEWQTIAATSPAAFGGAATNITYDDRNERILALKNYAKPFGTIGESVNELWQLGKNASNWSLVCGECYSPRSDASLVHTGESLSTFVIGGFHRDQEIDGAWVLDNEELIQSHDDPPGRDRAGVSYNRDRQEVYVYGGNGDGCRGAGNNCDTTWILDLE